MNGGKLVFNSVVLVGMLITVSFLTNHSTLLQARTLTKAPSKAVATTKATKSSLVAGAQAALQTKPKASTAVAKTTSSDSSVDQARQLTLSGGKLLGSLVNIVCLSGNRSIPSVSGSGVIIDSRGVILTAAHVAQLFTLQDFLGTDRVQCLIRTGSPARRAYTAEPIYISQSWLTSNPATLKETSPEGTGQYDVALLAITGTATSTPLPSSFPYVPLAPTSASLHDAVAIGSYGAQYLSSSELNYSLYPILVFGSIGNRYTFDVSTPDLISIEGSAASQEGSSGGGIVNSAGQLVGTITTSSIEGSIQSRTLNAITPTHLRAAYLKDTGANLDETLQNTSLSDLISNFANTSKILGSTLAKTVGF